MKVGDSFKYKDVTLKVEEDKNKSCEGCFFYENDIVCIKKEIPDCLDSFKFVLEK